MICISNSTNHHVGPRGSSFVPDEYLFTIGRALTILLTEMRDDKGLNDEFKGLPGGKSFRDLFDDHTIWINYDSANNGRDWGWTVPDTHPKDLVITKYALRMDRWSTAATIVHELARLNGAPGGASHAAEHTVRACRMKSPAGPYDPTVIGQFINLI